MCTILYGIIWFLGDKHIVNKATPLLRLLGISGSLRRNSYCTAILQTLAEELDESAAFELFDLSSVPLYNEDDEGERLPQTVQDLRQAVERSDGVVLMSPEFNHGAPGVLKNALDWASRPAYRSPFAGKPTLILTASPAFTGGVRAQAQIADTLGAMLAHVVATPQVVIGTVHEKVVDGRMTDQAALQFLSVAIDALASAITLRRLARPTVA
jgi:chromate reductase